MSTFGREDVLLAHWAVAFDFQPGVNAFLVKFMPVNRSRVMIVIADGMTIQM